MAYVSNETKTRLTALIKAVLKKWDVKGTVGRSRTKSMLIVTIDPTNSKKVDFVGDYTISGERPWIRVHPTTYSGRTQEFVTELYQAVNDGNHDHSDMMTDYFNVGWYTEISLKEEYYQSLQG
jgi:hypothetical protein